MPRCILHLTYKDRSYYMMWSTIVNAPVTYGLPLKEFLEYMKEEYGNRGWDGLNESLQRARAKGCSWADNTTLEQTIRRNRAGPNEKSLSLKGIISKYIARRPNGK